MITHHEALISVMVLASAADRHMSSNELARMADMVAHLPIFADFERKNIPNATSKCAETLAHDEGIEMLMAEILTALPPKLRETAYALACDIVAADGRVANEEMEILEVIRHRLSIDRLIAAGIERGARARHTKL